MSTPPKQISTTALSKKFNLSTKDMFLKLTNLGLIEKKGEVWDLTQEGVKRGGKFIEHKKFGKYISWPENIKLDIDEGVKLISSTGIGKKYGLSAIKINFILSELGWVYKGLKGWITTPQGVKQGAVHDEDKRTGVPYVRWPDSILDNKILKNSIDQFSGTENADEKSVQDDTQKEEIGFREKFEAKHRSTDGHVVRSKAEMLIDNWLYMAEIVHAYERKLPIEEDVYSDFYIPTGKVYIEYWGYEDDPRYLKRKAAKQEIYEKYGFNLIELSDEHVQNLDDYLPRLLLKHGIQAY